MLRLEQCLSHVRGVCFMTTENVWFKCILGHCGGELGSTMKLVEKVTCNRAYILLMDFVWWWMHPTYFRNSWHHQKSYYFRFFIVYVQQKCIFSLSLCYNVQAATIIFGNSICISWIQKSRDVQIFINCAWFMCEWVLINKLFGTNCKVVC